MAPPYRYQFQRYRGVRSTRHECPACGGRHRKTFTRFVDTATGELLPAHFGRCNREENCGYFLSPYHKSPGEPSYAEQARQGLACSTPQRVRRAKPMVGPSKLPILTIPEELVQRSLTGYQNNHFAHLLITHFGLGKAHDLLDSFEIGTSAYWSGACTFWFRDEQNRVRGGQVVLFDDAGHTAKQEQPDGTMKRCTSWFHTAYSHALDQRHQE